MNSNNTRTGRLRSDIPNTANGPKPDRPVDEDTRFPHCDSRILHAPGKCQYCDLYPGRQQDRIDRKITFTGEPAQSGMYPCPAEQARTSVSLNRWPGNRAVPDGSEPDR